MKQINIFSRWICLAMLLGCVGVSWGQTAINWNENGMDLKGQGTNLVVNLTGNVSLNGQVVIYAGQTLTINNTSSGNVIITNAKDRSFNDNATYRMFIIYSGAKLVIKGQSGKQIVIDGGANFTWDENAPHRLTTATTNRYMDEAIWNQGTLELEYVTIQNVYGEDSGGGVYITGWSDKNGNNVVDNDDIISNGTTKISNCIIQKCAAAHGSALHITTQSTKTSDVNTPEKCAVTIKNTTIENCSVGEISGGKEEGGTIRTNGGAVAHLTLKNVTMKNNYSSFMGGGLYWNAGAQAETKCTIDGCTFENNYAGTFGGAMFLETTFEFTGGVTTVKGNKAVVRGGGINVNGYNGGGIPGGDFDYDLSDRLEIIDNESDNNGGGISFHFGQTSFTQKTDLTAKVNGVKVSGNKAKKGGGIYFYNEAKGKTGDVVISTSLQMDKGTIEGNVASENGGGIYVEKADIGTSEINTEKLSINQNTAVNGGGLYLSNGDLELGNIEMAANEAKQNGGGICIIGGTVDIQKGTITENKATSYGGGVYVENTVSNAQITLSGGGIFEKNTAKAGGGMAVNGPFTFNFAGTLQNNNAVNGGGIYLLKGTSATKGATLHFNGGFIRNNTATGTPKLTDKTAYQKDADAVTGVGGGVFMADYTTLDFNVTDKTLGFYGNRATNAADDIFANGYGTSVTIPTVENMTLTDFSVPASKLFWAEDYYSYPVDENEYEEDGQYAEGTKLLQLDEEQTPKHNLRYRYALEQLKRKHIIKVDAETFNGSNKEKYVCLALGYEIFYVTIEKKGLDEGESAMFDIFSEKVGANPYISMLLTGNGKGKVSKRVALPQGKWTVTEKTDWSWAYTSVGQISIEKEVTDDSVAFEFENTKDAEILHDEAIKVNKMGGTTNTLQ